MSGKETFKKIEIQHFLKVFLCDIISMFYKRNITFQKPYAMNYYQDVEPMPKCWTSTKQLGPALACLMVRLEITFYQYKFTFFLNISGIGECNFKSENVGQKSTNVDQNSTNVDS